LLPSCHYYYCRCIGSAVLADLQGPSGMVAQNQVAVFDASGSKDPDGEQLAYVFSCARVADGSPCFADPNQMGTAVGPKFTQDLNALVGGQAYKFTVSVIAGVGGWVGEPGLQPSPCA
jgi:hypothetical protein